MSVKVAVRVRPFNQREKFLGCTNCIQMKQKTTTLTNPRDRTQKQYKYKFDYCLWSYDGYKQLQNGYLSPIDDRYIDQQKLFKQLGEDILTNSWNGFNCCLFAYGQTGAGKSYSMIGYQNNKGIIPIACEKLFERVEKTKILNKREYEIRISMIEIYNQKVHDLLIYANKRPINGLKIRESKKMGVYVEGLSRYQVHNYLEIQKKMDDGGKNRSLASTLMNQYSSRAHTIVIVELIQKQFITKEKMNKKTSLIYLVDLAGSQRIAKTGISAKDRLKEASQINKSLHTLGRVIQSLAEVSGEKNKNLQIPYRQSALTRILETALGGNSVTTMICAISPANDNYQQTLSTLRYADQAKKIKNKPIVNENAVDKIIRELREQNEDLKQKLRIAKLKGINLEIEQPNIYSNIKQIEKEIRKNMKSFAINTEEMRDQIGICQFVDFPDPNQIEEQDCNCIGNQIICSNRLNVYITNLNEDRLLCYKVQYSCEQDLYIGNRNMKSNYKNKLILFGLGIEERHARIYKNDNKYYIETLCQQAIQYTLINGKYVIGRVQLFNNDRIIFGNNCVFLFKNLYERNKNDKKALISNLSSDDDTHEQLLLDWSEKQEKMQNQLSESLKFENLQDGNIDDKIFDYQYAINERENKMLESPLKNIKQNNSNLVEKRLLEIQKQYNNIKQQNSKKIKQKQLIFRQQIKKLEIQKQQQKNKFIQQIKIKQQQIKFILNQKQKIQKIRNQLIYQQKLNQIKTNKKLQNINNNNQNNKHYIKQQNSKQQNSKQQNSKQQKIIYQENYQNKQFDNNFKKSKIQQNKQPNEYVKSKSNTMKNNQCNKSQARTILCNDYEPILLDDVETPMQLGKQHFPKNFKIKKVYSINYLLHSPQPPQPRLSTKRTVNYIISNPQHNKQELQQKHQQLIISKISNCQTSNIFNEIINEQYEYNEQISLNLSDELQSKYIVKQQQLLEKIKQYENKLILLQQSSKEKKQQIVNIRKSFIQEFGQNCINSNEKNQLNVITKNMKQQSYNIQTTTDSQIQKRIKLNLIQCKNENILNERNIQIKKKRNEIQQLKKIFIKKQKKLLQKKLIQLIPMIEKFNLLAFSMNKNIQCKIEIQYHKFSYNQIIQAIKFSMESKINIIIKIYNYQQGRTYKWSLQIFKNRFEIIQNLFQKYLQNYNKKSHIERPLQQFVDFNKNPFWDPIDYQSDAIGYLSLQPLLYGITFNGQIRLVNKGKIIGYLTIKLQTFLRGTLLKLKQQFADQQTQNLISDPKQLLDKDLSFILSIEKFKCTEFLPIHRIQKYFISYSIFQECYQQTSYQSEEINIEKENVGYSMKHHMTHINDHTLIYLADSPLCITLHLLYSKDKQMSNKHSLLIQQNEQLQNIHRFSLKSMKKTQSQITIPSKNSLPLFQGQKSIIIENKDMLLKIQQQYNNIQIKQQNNKQLSPCIIF